MDLPIEVLVIIFHDWEYSLHTIIRVCKRWRSLFTNINVMIRAWRARSDFNGYVITKQLMQINRVVPDQGCAKLMVFGFNESKVVYDDRLVELFIEYYNPGWKNLPMPTWEQIVEHAGQQRLYEKSDDRRRSQFTQMLVRACSNPHAFRYLYQMCLEHNQVIDRFHGYALEYVSHMQPLDVAYVDWFVNQPFCRMNPFGLRCLIRAGLPLTSVKKYVEMHVTSDWNGWDGRDDYISNGKQEMYNAAYRAYEWQCFIEPKHRKIPVQLEWFDGLEYFYVRCATETVRNMICVAQNGMSDHQGWIFTAEERVEMFAYLDSLIDQHKHLHPVEAMHAYSWYKTNKPYVMEAHSCPDDCVKTKKNDWNTTKSRKGKAI